MKNHQSPYQRNVAALDGLSERLRTYDTRRKETLLLVSMLTRLGITALQVSLQMLNVCCLVLFALSEFLSRFASSAESSLLNFEDKERSRPPVQHIPYSPSPAAETVVKQPETPVSSHFSTSTPGGGEKATDRRRPSQLVKKDETTVIADGKEYTKADLNRELNSYSKRCVNVDGSVNSGNMDKVAFFNYVLRFIEGNHDLAENF